MLPFRDHLRICCICSTGVHLCQLLPALSPYRRLAAEPLLAAVAGLNKLSNHGQGEGEQLIALSTAACCSSPRQGERVLTPWLCAQTHLNIVVIGHVDSGKSTTTGHLVSCVWHLDMDVCAPFRCRFGFLPLLGRR